MVQQCSSAAVHVVRQHGHEHRTAVSARCGVVYIEGCSDCREVGEVPCWEEEEEACCERKRAERKKRRRAVRGSVLGGRRGGLEALASRDLTAAL